MSREDEIVLSFHESLLRTSDVELLYNPLWLNDQIISFFFEYLEKRVFSGNNDLLFISPEVTQCLKIVPPSELPVFLTPLNAQEKKFIFFALNDNLKDEVGGSHWSLLVFSRPENSFFHVDSMEGSNIKQSQYLAGSIRNTLQCPDAGCIDLERSQQVNTYDCGIHVLCETELLAEYAVENNKIEGAPQLQRHLLRNMRSRVIDIIRRLGGKL